MEGVIRILTTLALGAALAVASPGVAVADPTPTPTSTPSPSASVVATPDVRVGGTPGAPEPPTPGWVWWAGAAIVLALGAGGVRFWRYNRWPEGEDWPDDEPATVGGEWPDDRSD